ITKDQITTYQIANPDRSFYLGLDHNLKSYAFGEIIPQIGHVPRLSRILIGAKENRGISLGQFFVKQLIQECIAMYNCKSVELFVWDQNQVAIKCYAKVGFKCLPEKQMTMIHEDKRYDIYKMKLDIF
ncbi:MAG: GNAT family N-acetyltransferase, partial [Phormidesmis sp. FL-bin-119]|nr:GNAT family N-acetyltransferase [Pedobacter sp.]